jgi:DNA-binding MarR family transcriptional regulator
MRDYRFRESIPHLTGILFRRIARVHGRAVKRFEISSVQANILATLFLKGSMTVGDLQVRLALGSSTITGALDRMEKQGLVKREPSRQDKRSVVVSPPAWPTRKREALLDTLETTGNECFARLSAAERRQLAQLLGKAIGSIAELDEGGDDDDEPRAPTSRAARLKESG